MQCPKFKFEITEALKQSYCKNCEGCEHVHSTPKLGKIDPYELARLLKAKQEQGNKQPPREDVFANIVWPSTNEHEGSHQ